MISAAFNSIEVIESLPPGAVILLPDISWEEYEETLKVFEGSTHVRLTYDQGRLEIRTLSSEHEGYAGLFTHLISVLTEELGMPFLARRSTTLKRQKFGRSAEADDCFYFKNLAAIANKKKLDLEIDPPPDLAIEVDIAHGSLSKMSIYADLGIPELWRFDGEHVTFYRLTAGQYQAIPKSALFPFLSSDVLPEFLRQRNTQDINAMRITFRGWVQKHRQINS